MSFTFGYLWYKEDDTSNDRHLYLGKSGKGSCIHIVYNIKERTAFKSNIGYFKECDINKSLKRGAGGTYLMILSCTGPNTVGMFCAMYLLIKKYPECKLIDWTDNSMITLRINKKEYDVSLNNSDTIITGYPRIQNIISEEAIVFDDYKSILYNIHRLNEIHIRNQMTFNEFYNTFFTKIKDDSLFTQEELIKLNDIYNNSESLLIFFKKADNYLTTVNKKKYIFIPLQDIFNHYYITNFIWKNWIVDLHKAFNHIKQKYNISFSRYQVQSGNGYNSLNIKRDFYVPNTIYYQDLYVIKNKSYYLPIYRNIIKML